MSRLFEALRNAADGAIVVDEDLRVIYWNSAAEDILGFECKDVTGQFCFHLLNGYDDDKRLVCTEQCLVAKRLMQSKPVANRDIQVETSQGEKRWLNMSMFAYRMNGKNGKKVVVHLFRDLKTRKADEAFLSHLIEVARSYRGNNSKRKFEKIPDLDIQELTSREHEVLNLMINGHGTTEIGELLYISPNTVRNHIQHILQKFQVNTRLEAVVYAIKNGLVSSTP